MGSNTGQLVADNGQSNARLNLKCEELEAENEQLRIQLADVGEIKEQIAEIKNLKAELKEQIKILKASNNDEETKFSFINNERIEK